MKQKIDLTSYFGKEIRLYRSVEYILTSSVPIIVSAREDAMSLYPKCVGNGTEEVYMVVTPEMASDSVWIFNAGRQISVRFEYSEDVLANHLEDITPEFIHDEYPLFKKMMEYYFLYLGAEFNPSSFIHNMEKYAHIDQTFDEFREYVYSEVLHEFPKEMAASKQILSKYILQFYNQRGTEESIHFLFRILYASEITLERGRDTLLVTSDEKQGIISDKSIVLQDNYMHSVFSYVIRLQGVQFSKYEDILYKLVNPTGYLPFGQSEISYEDATISGGAISLG